MGLLSSEYDLKILYLRFLTVPWLIFRVLSQFLDLAKFRQCWA